jgi:hypothetical protein
MYTFHPSSVLRSAPHLLQHLQHRIYIYTSIHLSIRIHFVDPESVTRQLDMKEVILKSQNITITMYPSQQSTTTAEYFHIVTSITKQFYKHVLEMINLLSDGPSHLCLC